MQQEVQQNAAFIILAMNALSYIYLINLTIQNVGE